MEHYELISPAAAAEATSHQSQLEYNLPPKHQFAIAEQQKYLPNTFKIVSLVLFIWSWLVQSVSSLQ